MELFEQFIQERVYLKGVSPKTVISYACWPCGGWEVFGEKIMSEKGLLIFWKT
jgi:hypothetical protein